MRVLSGPGIAFTWLVMTSAPGCGLRAPGRDGEFDAGAQPPACTSESQCTAPPRAAALCVDGKCTYSCQEPLLRCDGGCCGAVAISAGDRHTCAVTEVGSVLCWGARFLTLDGTFTPFTRPVEIDGLDRGGFRLGGNRPRVRFAA